ncbi:hypothetical protein BXY85_1581 [Roseivirga pacifica]|uniref:DUF3299 domain-containing protein n=1 Tax=Roseivirga pacifica TaxID=1267423 RepID=A0A1I0MNJ8_9BACT|nr:hypothetical protein [Roseivirga pacifica]RKQ50565.1 hypothetical protein BXY85_1581 [Roseivirga pacifica]SEV90044.1 hypothetical protein SAMN05216290_0565 [Roseivirga pacifica]
MINLRTVLMLCLFGLGLSATKTQAQEVKMKGAALWKTLADVSFEIKKDEYGDLYVPVFSEAINGVEGEVVEVEGFIIPFDGMFKPTELILSSLPISECFFCGSGGPETVMEISMKEKIKYTTKRVKIRGKLKLNADDPDQLMYLLTDGVFVGLADDSY